VPFADTQLFMAAVHTFSFRTFFDPVGKHINFLGIVGLLMSNSATSVKELRLTEFRGE
jgi:hypothetical protein